MHAQRAGARQGSSRLFSCVNLALRSGIGLGRESLLFSTFFLFITFAAQAAVVCIGPAATGNGSGSDWSNLRAWSSTPARGDTWYVSDGSYSGKTFNTAPSGTTVTMIKKATVADHGPSTGWSNAMGDGIATFSNQFVFASDYWIIDGVTGGGPNAWESGYGFEITETGASNPAIDIGRTNSANYVTVRHCKLIGMNNTNSNGGSAGNDGIAVLGGGNIVLSYLWIQNMGQIGRAHV